ncbi:MAG: cyclic nucleotide-binding domain-containing protein [Planctomycetes bacterium]|nr:cyclic nucleotide-binding domain-containing protein [Planctomycetota bacterium]MCL4729509.1 cyclic nucleotide-binding domain-containing protein [Planctomycetota bacterium]
MNLRTARLLEYAPGEIIYRQGARAASAFVLRAGSARSTVIPEKELAGADDGRLSRGHSVNLHNQIGTFLGCEGTLCGHYIETLIAVETAVFVEVPLDAPGVMSTITEDVAFGLSLARTLARRLVAANKNLGSAQRIAGRFTRELQGLCADFYNLIQRLGEDAEGEDAVLQALSAAKRTATYAAGESGGAEVAKQTRRIMAKVVDSSEMVGTRLQLRKGELLCRRGDPGDTVYVLVSGRLSVRIGAEQFGIVRPGEIVGEIGALLGDEEPKRIADVVAEEPCVVGVIPVERFPLLVQKQPRLLINLCKLLTLRVRSFEQLAAESEDALRAVVARFAGPGTTFLADVGALRRALEALVAEQNLPLQQQIEQLQRMEERWQEKLDELHERIGAARA